MKIHCFLQYSQVDTTVQKSKSKKTQEENSQGKGEIRISYEQDGEKKNTNQTQFMLERSGFFWCSLSPHCTHFILQTKT